MIETKLLGIENLEQVIQLLENRNNFSKQSNEGYQRDYLIASTHQCLVDGVRNRIVGCIDDGDLKAILCQTIMQAQPYWHMNYYATSNNKIALGKGYGIHLSQCFKKAMQDAEEKNYYDFWFSVPEAYAKNGPRMQKTSEEWMRYEVYTDAVVPANTFPEFELHKRAYGKVLKPHAVFIRHAVLKQEFRSVPLTR